MARFSTHFSQCINQSPLSLRCTIASLTPTKTDTCHQNVTQNLAQRANLLNLATHSSIFEKGLFLPGEHLLGGVGTVCFKRILGPLGTGNELERGVHRETERSRLYPDLVFKLRARIVFNSSNGCTFEFLDFIRDLFKRTMSHYWVCCHRSATMTSYLFIRVRVDIKLSVRQEFVSTCR